MRTQLFLATAIACLLASTVRAELVILEEMIETSSAQVTLPSTIPGTLVVRNCPNCKTVVLKAEASTQFLLANGEAVTLAELQRLCGTRPVGYALGYQARSLVLSRVMTDCVRPAG